MHAWLTVQDSKPADARDLRVCASLHAAHSDVAPRAPLEAAEPALQPTREQLQVVVCVVSTHHRGTAAGPLGWTFEMICAACQSANAALDVTLELVTLILSRELPREAFLIHRVLVSPEKPTSGVRPIALKETWYHIAGGLRAADMRAWRRRWRGPLSGGRRHARRHGDCGAHTCVGAC